MADTIERYVVDGDTAKGYRAVFWFGTGLGELVAISLDLFVRIENLASVRNWMGQVSERGAMSNAELWLTYYLILDYLAYVLHRDQSSVYNLFIHLPVAGT